MKRIQQNEENGQLTDNKKRRVIARPAIIDEVPVDQDVIDGLEGGATKLNLCKLFGLRKGIPIEIEYVDGTWTPSIIENVETGETHRIHDDDGGESGEDDEGESGEDDEGESGEDDGDDFEDVPIIRIRNKGEVTDTEVCVVGGCLIYDIEKRDIFNWKMYGDPWEEDEDGDGVEGGDEIKVLEFTDKAELRKEIEKFVPSTFVNVLEKNRELFDRMPPSVQSNMTVDIIRIKDAMVEKIIKYFEERSTMLPGDTVVMNGSEMRKLCTGVLTEIYNETE